MYGKQKIFLKDNFYFLYPGANLKAMVGMRNAKNDKLPVDELVGGIYQEDDNFIERYKSIGRKAFNEKQNNIKTENQYLSTISGSWLKSICFDQQEYWTN